MTAVVDVIIPLPTSERYKVGTGPRTSPLQAAAPHTEIAARKH
jgi:hypothetical protein